MGCIVCVCWVRSACGGMWCGCMFRYVRVWVYVEVWYVWVYVEVCGVGVCGGV